MRKVDVKDVAQAKAYARIDGALTALLWIAAFAMQMYYPAGSMGGLLAVSSPLFVGWRLLRFRDEVLGGAISFRRAYYYSFYTFVCASLVFALAQYVYFRFIDGGQFVGIFQSALSAIEEAYKQSNRPTADIEAMRETVSALTPVNWAVMIMVQNISIGVLASLPIALFFRRKSEQAT